MLFLPELLTPAALDVLRSRITAPRSYWARNSVPAETLALLDLLAALQNSRTDAAALTSERVLEAALLSLEDAPEPPEPRTAPSPAVSRSGAGRSHLYAAFLRLLESPALFQRSVHEFAHHLGCTPKTLTLAVHEHGGRTAKQAIDARLVLEAKRLLAYQADASVARIASELGFDDPANFSKFFRRNVGASPGGWRRTMIAAEAARDRS
ncbi:helix-turn-helix domain-containing protein [Agromyces sp. NPDC060279]|uniref:helix-turn-helix domain-containing protein n=1 Tax=Agromyces sp. NPDC060279 TaxID=3347092 RepID=UPI00365DC745